MTEIPEPEVRARVATDDEIPRGAKTIVNLANKHGWDVRITYARGPYLDANGKVNRTVDSIAVRTSRADAFAYATWVTDRRGDYKFNTACVVGQGLVDNNELKTFIKREGA